MYRFYYLFIFHYLIGLMEVVIWSHNFDLEALSIGNAFISGWWLINVNNLCMVIKWEKSREVYNKLRFKLIDNYLTLQFSS